LLRPGLTVLHVAPEKALIRKLYDRFGAGYRPADFDPARYKNDVVEVARIDLCRDMRAVSSGSFDLIMHLHVLEHLPCSLDTVFRETMRILRPGGSFIFGAAIVSGNTIENISPDLLPEERIALFRQHDHVRLLGSKDFPRFLKRVLGSVAEPGDHLVDPRGFADEATLRSAGIPYEQVRRWSSHALFHVRKRRAAA
jgi:SAM-dependent methyltransferase